MGDAENILGSLRREADALSELELRSAQLGGDRRRGHADLDALTAAIDVRIDASIQIWERLAGQRTCDRDTADVRRLERQFRRLGVLRAQVLALYVALAVDPPDC